MFWPENSDGDGRMMVSPRNHSVFSVRQLCVCVVLFSCAFAGVAVLQRAKWNAREASRLGWAAKLRSALREYHGVNGHFPPAYVVDSKGRPMHSWRVLLL